MLLIQIYLDVSVWMHQYISFTVGEVGEVFRLQTWTQAVLNNNDNILKNNKNKTKTRTLGSLLSH